MIKISKKVFLVFVFTYIFSFFCVNSCLALISIENDQTTDFRTEAGFDDANFENSLSGIIATVVQAFLGLLGIIFLIILVLAGYKYMTARGSEDKTKEALDSIRRAIIGLIIIVSAYAITYFIFDNLPGDGGGSGTDSSVDG